MSENIIKLSKLVRSGSTKHSIQMYIYIAQVCKLAQVLCKLGNIVLFCLQLLEPVTRVSQYHYQSVPVLNTARRKLYYKYSLPDHSNENKPTQFTTCISYIPHQYKQTEHTLYKVHVQYWYCIQ